MKKIYKFLVSTFCLAMLCGCTINVGTSDDNTVSNKKDETTVTTTQKPSETATETTTETPSADPVASLNDLSSSKVVWGPGTITDHKQPADPVSLQETFGKYNGTWLLNDSKSICLTFDEGYENGYTPTILDTLKRKNVKAIFFVTYDFAKENPKLIKRMIDEGHIVGNHSYRHLTMDEIGDEKATEEVEYLHNYIKKNFNYTMSYFRFPKGEFSQRSIALVNNLGYKSVFWSFAYADWDPDNQQDKDTAYKNICNSTHSGEIMLLHAVSKTNAEILGDVIDDIKQQGYTFTTKI